MNVRTLRQEDKIRRIDFGEHILGFRFGPYPSDRSIYRPFQQSSNTQRHRVEDNNHNKIQNRHIKTTSGRRFSPDKLNQLVDLSEEEQQCKNDEQLIDDNEQLQRQKQKHIQFIRSYQGWLQDSHAEGYQSARMTTSLGVKKGKITERASSRNTLQLKNYQLQGNQYKQSKIFPCRNNNSIKRIKRKHEKQQITQAAKYKSQGQLKLKLVKNMIKSEIKPQQTKKGHHNQVRSTNRISSAILRTFSNPKILSIQNRQLVKGTKIYLQ